jgi:hypothetical protein
MSVSGQLIGWMIPRGEASVHGVMQPSIPLQPTHNFASRFAGRALSAACAILLATAAFCRAESAPTFDLRAKNGTILDASAAARPVETPGAKVAADGVIEITAEPAIIIPYREADPLFQSGAFTWIIKARFKDPVALPEGRNYGLFWRWNAAKNARSVCLQLNEGNVLLFSLNTNGTLDPQAGVTVRANAIPPDEWVTFVCRFEPNSLVSMEIYDPNNQLLKKAVSRQNIPAEFFSESDVPFTIGTPEALGYSISHVQVWKEFIPDENIPDLLGK